MGTHPIFESDFDCLTDMLSRAIRAPVGQLSRRRAGYAPFTGQFNTYPPKKVYYGKGNISGEAVLAMGFAFFSPHSTTWSSVITCTTHTACHHLTSTWTISSWLTASTAGSQPP